MVVKHTHLPHKRFALFAGLKKTQSDFKKRACQSLIDERKELINRLANRIFIMTREYLLVIVDAEEFEQCKKTNIQRRVTNEVARLRKKEFTGKHCIVSIEFELRPEGEHPEVMIISVAETTAIILDHPAVRKEEKLEQVGT